MIKSVSATPVYTNVGDWEAKKLTGFGIFIDCDVNDAYEIFNLIKEMTERRNAAKQPKNMDNNYWIDTNANGGTDWILYRLGDVEILRGRWPEDARYGHVYSLPPERDAEIWGGVDTRIKDKLGFVPEYSVRKIAPKRNCQMF